MKKKLAVVVRDRQAEALRMALGLTLENDEVNVFVLDHKLDRCDESVAMSLAMFSDVSIKIISNLPDDGLEYMNTEAVAQVLPLYDAAVVY